jgi:hypothetical protein
MGREEDNLYMKSCQEKLISVHKASLTIDLHDTKTEF